ncbi:hypothetical protein M8494_13410 [Serratia ureilytica]
MFRGLKAFLLLTLSLLFCQRAFADCATTNGTVTLPGSSSFVVYNGQINARAPPASTAPASGFAAVAEHRHGQGCVDHQRHGGRQHRRFRR